MNTKSWFYSPELYTYKSYVEDLEIDWIEYELIYKEDKINTLKVNELFINKDGEATVSQIRLDNDLNNPNTKLVYAQPFTQIQHEISLNHYFPSRTLINKFNKTTEFISADLVKFKDNHSFGLQNYCLTVNTAQLYYIQNTTQVEIILINKVENKIIALEPDSNSYYFLKLGSNWQVQLSHYDYDDHYYYPEAKKFIDIEIKTYKAVTFSVFSKASLCLSNYTYTTKLTNNCIEVGITNTETNTTQTKFVYMPVIKEVAVASVLDRTSLLQAQV